MGLRNRSSFGPNGGFQASRSVLQRLLLNALRAGGLATIQHATEGIEDAAEGCDANASPADGAASAWLLCGYEVVSFDLKA